MLTAVPCNFARASQVIEKSISFRHFLEKHHAGEQILALINQKLKQAGLMLRQGIIIDATIISAPCSVKNKAGQRDPEMHQTRKEISGTLV
jgi:IS5 family transposase